MYKKWGKGIPGHKGILVVSASASPVTAAQVSEAYNLHKLEVFKIPLEYLLEARIEEMIPKLLESVCDFISKGLNVAVVVESVSAQSENHKETEEYEKHEKGVSVISRLILESLSKVVKIIIQNTCIGALILLGGDTAFAVCRLLGCRSIMLLDEIFLELLLELYQTGHMLDLE